MKAPFYIRIHALVSLPSMIEPITTTADICIFYIHQFVFLFCSQFSKKNIQDKCVCNFL